MRDKTSRLRFSGAWAPVLTCLLLPAAMAWGEEEPPASSAAKVFTLEEVSILDCPEWAASSLQTGLYANEYGNSPLAGITCPGFKSSKPICGAVTFDMSFFDPQAGLQYGFAVDESAGTGTGYDLLYFDLNHDSDLTNDAVVTVMKEVPAGMPHVPEMVLFEKIQVRLDYGPEGVWTQAIMPRVSNLGDRSFVSFVAPTARKGKIVLGAEEVEVVLAQSQSIAGRYDRPMTSVFFPGKQELLPFVGCWRRVNGAFYRLSPSPAGDKITVEPYSGPVGTFEVNAGGRDPAPVSLDLGWLLSKNAIIDVTICREENGKWTVPVGDYRPLQLSIRYGRQRIGLQMDLSQTDRKTAPPAVFPFKVREDKPFAFDFSERPQVAFKTPSAGQRVKRGDTLQIEAILFLAGTGTMIGALEDTTKKTMSLKLPDGRTLERFESVNPNVKIVSSSGQTVAEGEMPFG